MSHRLLSLCAILLGTLTAPAAPAADALRPNIIFILADDLGYGDLGCYGSKLIQTPTLDRLAAEGMRFSQFYAGCTVCAPSRSVLMTGQDMGHTRVRGNAGSSNPAAQQLLDDDLTVAELLKSVGYQTGLIGKWGLGEPNTPGIPNQQGFDYFYGYLNQHHAHNHYPNYLWRNDAKVHLSNVVTPVGDHGGGYATKRVEYAGDLFAEEAITFVDQNHAHPFFLYLAFVVPHANNERTRALGDGQEVPDYGIYEDKDWPNPDKGQAAMVTRMDTQIGSLLQRLKHHGIADNTLVFFTSDNGPHKEGGNNPDFFDANGPYSGIKRSLTDGGIRVPAIAHWPAHIQPGQVTDHVAYFGDMMATFAELSGAPTPPNLQSLSLLPLFTGRTDAQPSHEFLYWEFHERTPLQALLLNGRWKGIRDVRSDTLLLHDLHTDIAEHTDVASSHPDIVAKIRSLLETATVPNEHWDIHSPPPAKNKGA